MENFEKFEKLLIPLIIGFLSWLIKNYFVNNLTKRDETIKAELKNRLENFFSPLYYWSGILLFNGKDHGWEKHGIKEIEKILPKNAHLLPTKHYYNIIKIIEYSTNQNTKITTDDIIFTRKYIYDQIKIYNYIIYKQNNYIDIESLVDPFFHYKSLLRRFSFSLLHIALWIIIFSLLASIYLTLTNNIYWPTILCIIFLVTLVSYDTKIRIRTHRDIKKRINI